MTFSQFPLNPDILKAVESIGFVQPTPIQALTIPHLLSQGEEVDFVGQARTGTGKTLAFLLPLLQRLDPQSDQIQAVILAPTRELVMQIMNNFNLFSKHLPFQAFAIYGGASYDMQRRVLKHEKPAVIVATCGRLLDLMQQNALDLSHTKFLVLDEADEMLKMGFLEDVTEIISSIHENKRIWMFSATMSPSIRNLVKDKFLNPHFVKVNESEQGQINEYAYLVNAQNHFKALSRLLQNQDDIYGLIFCQTKSMSSIACTFLQNQGFRVDKLNGDMTQSQRETVMKQFKGRKLQLLTCTDVAARGLDINDLNFVINLGLPKETESYIHRIGRTGRAGKEGLAMTLVDPKELHLLDRLKKYKKREISMEKLPQVSELKQRLMQHYVEAAEKKKSQELTSTDSENIDNLMQTLSQWDVKDLITYLYLNDLKPKLSHLDHCDLKDLDHTKVRGIPKFKQQQQQRRGGSSSGRYGRQQPSGFRRNSSSSNSANRSRKNSSPRSQFSKKAQNA